jgi:hypothetical protein
MKAEEVIRGRKVFWAGLTWHKGQPTPYLREGIIIGTRWNKVEVQCPDGSVFLKKREKLHTDLKQAQAQLQKLTAQMQRH